MLGIGEYFGESGILNYHYDKARHHPPSRHPWRAAAIGTSMARRVRG